MTTEIPVAARLPVLAESEDPVVVEAEPQGSATRSMKSVARWVFRLVQELQWAGHEGAVVVAVVGDTSVPAPIGVNLALLVSPLVTTAVGERTGTTTASVLLEADLDAVSDGAAGTKAFPSPRDRVWVVPENRLADAGIRNLFELVIFEPGPDVSLDDVDLCVVVARDPAEVAIPADLADDVEVGVVLVSSGGGEVPTSIRIPG